MPVSALTSDKDQLLCVRATLEEVTRVLSEG
jgi:hypothetical protein